MEAKIPFFPPLNWMYSSQNLIFPFPNVHVFPLPWISPLRPNFSISVFCTELLQRWLSPNLHLLPVVLFLSIVLVVVRVVATRMFHLQNIPGPSWAAYTRLWLSKTLASGNSSEIFVNVNKTYGTSVSASCACRGSLSGSSSSSSRMMLPHPNPD